MFFISLPTSVTIGDTAQCSINGEAKDVTWRDADTLVIEPNDARTIIDVQPGGRDAAGTLVNAFICGNGADEPSLGPITIIRAGRA